MQSQFPHQPYPNISSYIAIAITGDNNQRHIGVLFRKDKNNPPKLLHLAFHSRLQCDEPIEYASKFFWLHCPSLSEDEQLQLAVWFETIFAVNGSNIPYGLAYSSSGYFDQNGKFIQTNENIGLTCATFVMALFEDFDLPIIDTESWMSRDDDKKWQKKIIECMEKDMKKYPHLYSNTHIETQISNIGVAVRFRPEEVAVSANIFEDGLITFQQAEPLGKKLLEQMGII
jgi:hypothetical protein